MELASSEFFASFQQSLPQGQACCKPTNPGRISPSSGLIPNIPFRGNCSKIDFVLLCYSFRTNLPPWHHT